MSLVANCQVQLSPGLGTACLDPGANPVADPLFHHGCTELPDTKILKVLGKSWFLIQVLQHGHD